MLKVKVTNQRQNEYYTFMSGEPKSLVLVSCIERLLFQFEETQQYVQTLFLILWNRKIKIPTFSKPDKQRIKQQRFLLFFTRYN